MPAKTRGASERLACEDYDNYMHKLQRGQRPRQTTHGVGEVHTQA